MLNRALTSLGRSADGVGVLVVGGVLTLLAWTVTPVWLGGVLVFPPLLVLAPLALAPALVGRGYLFRVLAGGLATGNADGAPPFVGWGKLYKDGVVSALVSAVLLAPLALLFGLVGVAGVALGVGAVDPVSVAAPFAGALGLDGLVVFVGLAGGLLAMVTAAYLIGFAYVRPAALAAVAASGRLRDGLRPKRVRGVAGSGAYVTAWVVAAVSLLAGYALAAPFVPVLIGIPLVFATRVVAHALYGRGAAGAIGSPNIPSVAVGAGAADTGAADGRSTAAGEADRDSEHQIDRRRPAEASPTVQTGRGVSFGGDVRGLIDGDGGVTDGDGGRNADGGDATGGREAAKEADRDLDRHTGGADGDPGGSDGGFEWMTDIEDGTGGTVRNADGGHPEDKS
ncbi:hypothetical protein C461_10361 [Halorubrum aidingense JCM 13560]|uniref:DUF4013 domain-containing protein n=1 Tax=Halorubrum aidingense JCM 13560 TaxID=1230454 RepID=M0PDJ4_9EURY|nr:DUF4013 domain-containing protein [Halorubrum aidingense]EMA66905.1 hypothetical protein C461_10361 [Halorubrum aidingense JCM 13560]